MIKVCIISEMKITLMRHGEVEGGAKYRGVTDDRLTAKGLIQMQQAVEGVEIGVVWSSPLLRCCEFAESLGDVEIIAKLAEIDFGDWDGLTYEEIVKSNAEKMALFHQQKYTPPNGESLREFKQRVEEVWLALMERNEDILVVTHAGVIRMILKIVLGLKFQKVFNFMIGYGCLIVLKIDTNSGFVQLEQVKNL